MIQDTSNQDVVIKPKRRTKLWVLSLASVFVLGGLGYVLASSPTADISIERESLKVHTVSKGNLIRDIITTGKIIAANAPQVYSPEQGYVSLNVMAGDFISEGDIVAIVDSPGRAVPFFVTVSQWSLIFQAVQ